MILSEFCMNHGADDGLCLLSSLSSLEVFNATRKRDAPADFHFSVKRGNQNQLRRDRDQV